MARTMILKKNGPRDPSQTDIDLGEKIRALRTKRGLSQSGLGEELGVSFQQIQKYEKGTNRVSAARLQKIAAVFGVAPEQLYGAIGHGNEIDSLLIGNDAATIRMLRAYSKIASVETQHRIVLLIESIADDQA